MTITPHGCFFKKIYRWSERTLALISTHDVSCCRYRHCSVTEDQRTLSNNLLTISQRLLLVCFLTKYEAATRKSVQRNKENEEGEKTWKCRGTSKGFNSGVACFTWVVCIADRLRLHNSEQELIN